MDNINASDIYKAITCALNISAPYKDEIFTQDIYFEAKKDKVYLIYSDGTLIAKHTIQLEEPIDEPFAIILHKEDFKPSLMESLEYCASKDLMIGLWTNIDNILYLQGGKIPTDKKCTKLVDFYNHVDKLHSVNKRATNCKNGYTWSPEMLQKISTIANITGESLVWYFNKSSNESPCMVESESGSIRAYIMPMAESKEIEVEEFDDI